ncbi:thioredoxin domain-containing protein [Microlunatus soli]|uniref:thioredoxin domain-containing protein n=1 Tax=Microlunatus soli TaxID=630515 RepID=UPI001E3C2B59|nr:thioredoxin domain-containing protein [Microlunatus soli]
MAGATSPYLLQHAHNPVDWWEWTDEALAEARRRDVPILLSVGYAACHWCHVMAHESFEDLPTATKINTNFVPIKVDREERPDVDAVYMQATQAMTGQGGWPMTVFLTPDGDPFQAGTYYPKQPLHGLPSFGQVLDAVAEAWSERRDDIRSGAADITRRLSEGAVADIAGSVGRDDLGTVLDTLIGDYDQQHGGFGGAPKFPPSTVLEGLLRLSVSNVEDRVRDQARFIAHETLMAMASGGIYDQLAGGFARYSVDSGWVVPHFEKMLYDNGLLLGLYLHDWRLTRHPRIESVINQTVEWLLWEMITEQGAFAASLDADSPGPDGTLTEGAYYLWDRSDLEAALGDQELLDFTVDRCRVTEAGTADDGRSTLQLRDPDAEQDPRWSGIRRLLATARGNRSRPARDDKIIAAWNGLVIDALAFAGALLQRPDWVTAAVRAATAIWELHWVDGRLRRTSRDGVVGRTDGNADDYALVALAFVRLAEVTGDPIWARRSRRLLTVLADHFDAPDGGFYDTADDAESLINRPKDPTDNATPSGLSSAVHAFARLAAYSGELDLAARSERAAGSAARLVTAAPRFAGWLLADVVTRTAVPAAEIAVVGDPDDPPARSMADRARRVAPAGSVVVLGRPDADGVPLLAGRTMIDGKPTAYVCHGFVCRLPVTDEEAMLAELSNLPR